MSEAQSKLQKLEDAGILEKRQFTPEELAQVAKISDEEIEVLIRLRKRLGAPAEDKHHIRPNIFV
jgi:hypothetical protein